MLKNWTVEDTLIVHGAQEQNIWNGDDRGHPECMGLSWLLVWATHSALLSSFIHSIFPKLNFNTWGQEWCQYLDILATPKQGPENTIQKCLWMNNFKSITSVGKWLPYSVPNHPHILIHPPVNSTPHLGCNSYVWSSGWGRVRSWPSESCVIASSSSQYFREGKKNEHCYNGECVFETLTCIRIHWKPS